MTPTQVASASDSSLGQLDSDFLIRALRLMYTSRRIDDREVLLKRQNRIFFQISAAGHEAAQIAAGLAVRPGYDWVYPYYRDRGIALALGVTAYEMMLQGVGAADDPASGGRQMPSHWSDPKRNLVTSSSVTGTQFLQAIGCAEALRYLHPQSDRIALVSAGEGATSEGEFWESINAACLRRLPVVYLIQDNGFAISVPKEFQTPGGNISQLLSGFPGLLREQVDGTDFIATYRALQRAVEHCRQGNGPAFVHAHLIRLYAHSYSDDEKYYRTAKEREAEVKRDPLLIFPRLLLEESVLPRQQWQTMMDEVDHEVDLAAQQALGAEPPAPETALRYLYSPSVDPCSPSFEVPEKFQGEPKTMLDLINSTLAEEMRRDEKIVVFGEDVADCSREDSLCEVKGKGGVFKVTAGLQTEFGSRRCFNAPIAEAAIVGRALGMATAGMKPIPEIQFFDYIWPAMMQIRDELANFRWRSHNGFSCPLVLRVPIGGYLNGGAIYHSQSGEVTFTHIPGLRVVMPSNAQDACGLLRTAIRSDDPVLFLEHKRLYREPYNRSQHPGQDYTIPFGKAKVVKTGDSLTVITYGATVHKALTAAAQMERKEANRSIEVIDLRSLSPYDWETIAASVRKTSRALVVHEDCLSWGYGAEIAARISDELFGELDAPVRRVAALDTWVGYSPQLENAILPQTEDITREIERLLHY